MDFLFFRLCTIWKFPHSADHRRRAWIQYLQSLKLIGIAIYYRFILFKLTNVIGMITLSIPWNNKTVSDCLKFHWNAYVTKVVLSKWKYFWQMFWQLWTKIALFTVSVVIIKTTYLKLFTVKIFISKWFNNDKFWNVNEENRIWFYFWIAFEMKEIILQTSVCMCHRLSENVWF